MRSSSLVLAAALLVFPASHAESATRSFSGTLAIQLASFPALVMPGAGVATVNGSNGAGHLTALELAGGTFADSGFVIPVTDPMARPVMGIQLTVANGPGAFGGSGGSGAFGGAMALQGVAKLCLHPCSAAVANLTVPLAAIGSGGAAYVAGAVNLTVVGAPWTTGTVQIGTLSAMGGVAPASNTDAIQLVTPVFISTNIPASFVIPSFASLSLSGLSVPEPGTLTLLGLGVVALVAAGRRRVER